jgi:hypothetical protein
MDKKNNSNGGAAMLQYGATTQMVGGNAGINFHNQ